MFWFFDFIHSYNTWQINKLNLFEIIDFGYTGDDKQFSVVGKYDVSWVTSQKERSINFYRSIRIL